MAVFLALGPAALWALATGRWRAVVAAALASIGLAEAGRRRAGGAGVFPASTALLAPLWLAERAVCIWAAARERVVHGGVRYAGGRVPRAASSSRSLRRRYRGSGAATTTASAVAETGSFEPERKLVSL
jgi:hypothetical protein